MWDASAEPGCSRDEKEARPDDDMLRNDAAAPGHVCPGIRIHAIDIVQPPGIGISPIPDMDVHERIVSVALATKSGAETPKK